LLHGMAASLRYWETLIPELSQHHRVISIDLLGFGRSPKPKAAKYDTQTQLSAIQKTLAHLNVQTPFVLVGHSMGALLSLELASQDARPLERLVLLNMPISKTNEEVRMNITQGKKTKQLAYYGWTSHLLCSTWCCLLRPVSRRIAPFYLRSLPRAVAEDSVLHSPQAYRQSLNHVLNNFSVGEKLKKLSLPTKLIYGNQESSITLNNLKATSLPPNVEIEILEGGHNVSFQQPQTVTRLILEE